MWWPVRLCCTGCKQLFIWFWWCWNSQTSHQTPWKWRSLFELCKSRALKCSGNLCAKCVEEQFGKTLVRLMGCWYLTSAWIKLKTTEICSNHRPYRALFKEPNPLSHWTRLCAFYTSLATPFSIKHLCYVWLRNSPILSWWWCSSIWIPRRNITTLGSGKK